MKRQLIVLALATVLVLSAILILIPPVASDGNDGGRSRGVSSVLFWDDSANWAPSAYIDYMIAISNYGASFNRVSSPPSLAQMQQYDVVFYYMASLYDIASYSDWNLLKSYLDAGGNLVWAGAIPTYGQNMLGYASFQQTYLGAQYYGLHYMTSPHTVVGSNGDIEITGSYQITGGHSEIWLNNMFHDLMRPVNGGVTEMYCTPNSLDAVMISKETPGYQTVQWTFDLNQLNSPVDQLLIMTKVLDWFDTGIPANVRLEPQSLNLDSNGNFVQVKVEGFPDNPEYSPLDVDGMTVVVGGVGVDLKYGTWNDNRWIGKADRLLVEDSIGAPGEDVEVLVQGNLNDGTSFFGMATIKAL